MVRRRSTVRFRNGAPLKYQVRSSPDSSHPTLWMGAVAALGGIWEIVSACEIVSGRADSPGGPTELARSAREGQPGGAGIYDGNRKPAVPSHWDMLSAAISPGGHTGTR